jgi:hypothetical protein
MNFTQTKEWYYDNTYGQPVAGKRDKMERGEHTD